MKYLTILLIFVSFNLKSQIVNIEGNRFYNDTNKVTGFIKGNLFINQSTNSLSLNSNIHVQIKQDSNRLYLFLFDLNDIKSGNSIIDNYRIEHFRFNYKLSKFITDEFFIQELHNNYLQIDSRINIGEGIRIKYLSNKSYKIYNGFLIMKENYLNSNSIYKNCFRYDLYISFNFKIDSAIFIVNTTYYQPIINDIFNYRISDELSLDIKISKHFMFEESICYIFQSISPKEVKNKFLTNKVSFAFLF